MDAEQLMQTAAVYFRQQQEMYGSFFYGIGQQIPETLCCGPDRKDDTGLSLENYRRTVHACRKCPLHKAAGNPVFGWGNPAARLMIIGGVPGESDIHLKRPFTGAAGELMNKILSAIDFSSEEVYFTNVLKCRTPLGRMPAAEEISGCLTHLHAQISRIDPAVLLAVGNVAAAALTGSSATVAALRGRPISFDERKLVITYHPAALIQDRALKPAVWDDVQKLRALYDDIVGDKPAWQPEQK